MLVVSLIFSGYSTAAHAFEEVFCEEGIGGKAENGEVKSHDFQKDHFSGSPEKADKDSKADCSDCHHCCSSSAVTGLFGSLITPDYFAVLLPFSHDTRDGNFIFHLHRPPKSLV